LQEFLLYKNLLPGTLVFVQSLHGGLYFVGPFGITNPNNAEARFDGGVLDEEQIAATHLVFQSYQQSASAADVVGYSEVGKPVTALVDNPDAHGQVFDEP
jgi:hypothetical protein